MKLLLAIIYTPSKAVNSFLDNRPASQSVDKPNDCSSLGNPALQSFRSKTTRKDHFQYPCSNHKSTRDQVDWPSIHSLS
jgi:hypothetical protein